MRILIYNLPYLNLKGKFVDSFDEFYEEVLKDYDIVILNFLNYSDLAEIIELNKINSIIIFMCNIIDELTYKKALELGDYCYCFYEEFKLKYRIRYLQKKFNKGNFFKYKNLFFDLEKDKLYKDREEIKLTIGEKEVLKTLIENKDRFISKSEILENCDYVEHEDSVKVLISRLRKLGFEIEALKNQGYRIKEEI